MRAHCKGSSLLVVDLSLPGDIVARLYRHNALINRNKSAYPRVRLVPLNKKNDQVLRTSCE